MNPHSLFAGVLLDIGKAFRTGRLLATAGAILLGALLAMPAAALVAIDSTPLSKQTTVPGNLVLVPSVEWPTVVTQANDPGVAEGSANYSTASVTTCPTGYSLVSGTCEISVPATPGCPATYTFNGTTCQRVDPATPACTGTYAGYTVNGTSCEKTIAATAACPPNYNAPSGGTCQGSVAATAACPDETYTRSGSTCSKNDTKLACPNSGSTYFKTTSSGGCYSNSSDSSRNEDDQCDADWARPTSNGTGKLCTRTLTATATYSCPVGAPVGSGSSMTCTLPTTTATYSCPSGAPIGSGSTMTCFLTGTPTYSCPAGTANGSGSAMTCTLTATTTYSCPTGTARGTGSSMICITASQAPTSVVNSYAGYFNPSLCYAYKYDAVEANRYFYPVVATTGSNFSCSGQTNTITLPGGGTRSEQLWSGNYLNWVSMQAIDTFRLALTGGYRVHRPAEGTPPDVSVYGSSRTASTFSTSEMPDTTYLEKANSDRWDDGYTKLRRFTTADTQVAAATPYSGNTGFRARIGALRNQMWFTPRETGAMGSGRAYNDPRALALPIVSGTQAEPGGATDAGLPALPYNPVYTTLPNAVTTTATNGTACGTDEPGCSSTTPLCSGSTSWNGTACVGSTVSGPTASNLNLCTNVTYPYWFNSSGTLRCQVSSTNTSSPSTTPKYNAACAASTTTAGGVTTTITLNTLPASGTSKQCTINTTVTTATTGTATAQYIHTIYGRDQVYAVSIRVKVCDGTLDTRDICTAYGSYYKPEGLLQKNAKKIRYSLFSYLSETGQQRQGGVMRARQKLIGPVSAGEIAGTEKAYPDRNRIAGIDNPEWDPTTGVFLNNPDATDTTATNGNIGTCTTTSTPDASGCAVKYSGVINYLNRFGQILTGQVVLKSFDNLSEMYYTALRYLRGLANISSFSNLTKLASSDLAGTANVAKYQNSDGLPVIEDWYKSGANAAVRLWSTSPAISTGTDGDPMLYQCQTTVVLGIGDTATNNEDNSDNITKDSGLPSVTWQGYTEFNTAGGKGNFAGMAYWGHLNDMRADVPNNDLVTRTAGAQRGQTISTYWVDVVELNNLKAATDNQYYNATKFGGYAIDDEDWQATGNATKHDAAWFAAAANKGSWTTATQTASAATGLGGTGNYFLPTNMFLANNGKKMIQGLTSAFAKISENLIGSGASLAANSTRLDNGTTTYQAVYYNGDWRGDLKAFPVSPVTGTIGATPAWKAASVMPPASGTGARKIMTCTGSGICSTGVDFLTTATFDSKADLGTDSTAQNMVINYLRGDSTNEVKNSGGTLRNRATALGDIINSQPVYVGAPSANLYNGKSFATAYQAFAGNADLTTRANVIYVAANDGMLHGFNAGTGVEVFAYLPRAVIKSGIKNISRINYGESANPHQFWNDGELVVSDVECAVATCPNAVGGWASVLVGTTGRGPAKAIYALDVTDPADPRLLWERSAADGASGSGSIGQVVGKPVIARVASDGTWAVLMGNGYNSASNTPALLQFNLATGVLGTYTTSGASNDGLAQPAVWISDDTLVDNVSTEAYAGDLNGKVWAFTLSASGGGTGTNIFVATESDGTVQPITAGLVAAKNKKDDQVWVFFGTGSFLSSFKATDGLQTWYGLIVQGADAVNCTGSCSTRAGDLRQRTIAAQADATGTFVATRAISALATGDMLGKKGWFIDLVVTGGAETGERMVTPNQFQGQLLIGTSRLPTNDDPCNPSGGGWVMAVDPFTGAPPTVAFFDANKSGNFTDDIVPGTDYITAGVGFDSIPNNPIFVGHTMLISFDNGTTGSLNTRPSGEGIAQRLSWRELVGQ